MDINIEMEENCLCGYANLDLPLHDPKCGRPLPDCGDCHGTGKKPTSLGYDVLLLVARHQSTIDRMKKACEDTHVKA